MSSRTDLAKPASDVMRRRQSDPAGPRSNRLTQNANVAYDDYDVVRVRT